jgi:hypothetical protein
MIQKTTFDTSLTSATEFANCNFLQVEAMITDLRAQFSNCYANTMHVVTTDCALFQEHAYRSWDAMH